MILGKEFLKLESLVERILKALAFWVFFMGVLFREQKKFTLQRYLLNLNYEMDWKEKKRELLSFFQSGSILSLLGEEERGFP